MAATRAGLRPGEERAIFWALVVAQLVPLWLYPHFPSQDGPIHLEIANLLLRLVGEHDPGAAHYFAVNDALAPTWLIYLPLAGLMAVAPPEIAERLLLTAYALLFAVGLRYALEGVRPGAGFLAVLGLPFVFSYLLHMGFYSFCFATALSLLVLGFWLRRRKHLSARAAAVMAILLLLVYWCHLVPLAITLLAIGTVAVAELSVELRAIRQSGEPWRRRALVLLGRSGLPVAACVPAAALLVGFMARQRGGEVRLVPELDLVKHLAVLSSLVSFDYRELVFSVGTQAVFVVLTFALLVDRYRRWSLRRDDALLLMAVAVALLYFAAPVAVVGGGLVNQRLQLFVCLLLLPWFASDAALERWRPAIVAAGAVLTLGFAAVHAWQYRGLNDQLEEYLSGEPSLPPYSTILSLSLAHAGVGPDGGRLSRRVEPFQHASGLLATRRGLIDLDSYQASTGYYPVVYRPECDPYAHLGSAVDLEELAVPRPHLDGYRGLGCSIDYLLLWGLTARRRSDPAVGRLLQEIESRSELVFVSPPRGLLRIYRTRAGGRLTVDPSRSAEAVPAAQARVPVP